MNADRDETRIVRSWLEGGATQLPDRVLDAVLDQLPKTTQRRHSWLARRFPTMNSNAFRFGIAGLAVVAVILLGARFLSPSNRGGPPAPMPTPTPIATPVPLSGSVSDLTAGVHRAGEPFLLPVTATLPAGWQGHVGGPYFVDLFPKGSAVDGLFFLIFDKVSADPCDSTKGMVDVRSTKVAGLVTALSDMPGIEVSDVVDSSLGGYSGTRLTITAPTSFKGCTLPPDGYVLWELPLGARISLSEGEQAHIWVLNVDGSRLVVLLQDQDLTATQRTEAQAILASVHIEPAN
ncbi:MAG TPA: hypothetical protein VF153_08935 [Candidatus Limnocylindria bacterium]